MTATQLQIEPSASPSSADLRLALRVPWSVGELSERELGWLALALREDPRGSLSGLLGDIQGERAQLWAVEDGQGTHALVVTRIGRYELCDVLEIQLCAGSGMHHWLHLLRDLEAHGRALGCRLVEVRGRRGWERMLPEYALRGIALEKEL